MQIISVFEIIMIFLFRNIVFKKRISKDFVAATIISIAMYLFNIYVLHMTSILIFIIIIGIISLIIRFNEGIKYSIAIIQTAIGLIITFLSECIAMIVCLFINNQSVIGNILIYAVVIIFWIITLYICSIIPEKYIDDLNKLIGENNTILIILCNIISVFTTVKILFDSKVIDETIGIQLLILLLVFFILTTLVYKSYVCEAKEKDRLKIENSFKPILEDYVEKLRANEHEYKNHLNAIYGMLKVGTHEEINTMVEQYIRNIKANNSLSNLLYVDNTILKAVLYSKLLEAEKHGISVEYHIGSNLKNIPLSNTDLVIVISNLLNNAIEAAQDCENGFINIFIREEYINSSTKYKIVVENSFVDSESINLNSIVKCGYSTKDTTRGYGLYNINSIVKKVNGNLIVDLSDDKFSVLIEI